MAIEIITGRAGKPHVNSEDVRAYQAYTAGPGRYVLHGGKCTMTSANNAHIAPGEILVDGTHVRVTGTGEDVQIDNGASSYKRVDIVALHYEVTGSGESIVESVEFTVVKGTPAGSSPEDPDMPTDTSILDGPQETYIPYARILIDGLAPQDPEMLVEQYALPVSIGGTGAGTRTGALDSLLGTVRGTITDDTDWDRLEPGVYYAQAAHKGGNAGIGAINPVTSGSSADGTVIVLPMCRTADDDGDVRFQVFFPSTLPDLQKRPEMVSRTVRVMDDGTFTHAAWCPVAFPRATWGSSVITFNNTNMMNIFNVSDVEDALGLPSGTLSSTASVPKLTVQMWNGDMSAQSMPISPGYSGVEFYVVAPQSFTGKVRVNYFIAIQSDL